MPVVALLLAAGCAAIGGDDERDDDERVTKADLKNVVLQPSDVGERFMQFDYGELTFADLQPGPRLEPGRFGRIAGWKARYRQTALEADGPLIVESFVDLFGSADGARRDLEAYRTQFEQAARTSGGKARLLERPRVGDGAYAFTLVQESATLPLRFFTVAWRNGAVTGAVTVNGADGQVDLSAAVALARKQNRRISS